MVSGLIGGPLYIPGIYFWSDLGAHFLAFCGSSPSIFSECLFVFGAWGEMWRLPAESPSRAESAEGRTKMTLKVKIIKYRGVVISYNTKDF